MVIRVWNRAKQCEEIENVVGGALVRFFYGTRIGRLLTSHILTRAWVSRCVGWYKSRSWSAHGIASFIERYAIQMDDFEEQSYQSFNEFFSRPFKSGARPFCSESTQMPAFAEARYSAYRESGASQHFCVKGEHLTVEALLGGADSASAFVGGPVLIARLAPVDYHRFHFPDDGKLLQQFRVHGALHSVNPLALAYKSDLFATNERVVSLLSTVHFGRLAYVEVGALCVGRIVPTHTSDCFYRGQEKGYFLFGGSTVIVLGEAGAWTPASDLLEQTQVGRETLVRLGESVGIARLFQKPDEIEK